MALLSESADVLPIHRKILAFSFIGWIFDFYDLLLLSFLVSSTSLDEGSRAVARRRVDAARHGARVHRRRRLVGGALADRYGRKPLLMITILVYSFGTLAVRPGHRHVDAVRRARDHRHRRRRRVGGRARAGRRDGAAARARPLRLVPAERIRVRALLRVDGRQPAGAVDRLARRVHAVRAAGADRRLHPAPDAGIGRLAAEREGRRQQPARLPRGARADARPGAAENDGARD